MHRRTALRGAALLIAGAMALTACGGEDSERSAADSSAPSSTSPAPATEQAAEPAVAPAVVEPATFTGPVVDEFGAELLQDAYAVAAEFLGKTTYDETLLRADPTRSVADFEFATAYMTADMATSFRSMVAGALAEDKAGKYGEMAKQLASMFIWGIDEEEGQAWRETGPMVLDHRIGQAQAAANGDGRLRLEAQQTATLRYIEEGSPVLLPFEKDVTLFLIPDSAYPYGWAIDGHEAGWRTGELIPDSGS
jgi:hypothetical protein